MIWLSMVMDWVFLTMVSKKSAKGDSPPLSCLGPLTPEIPLKAFGPMVLSSSNWR